MHINPNSIATDLQAILSEVISKFPLDGPGFEKELKDAKNASLEGNDSIVQIGELKFKVEVESRVNKQLQADVMQHHVSEETGRDSEDHDVSVVKPEKHDKETPRQGVHPGITFQLKFLEPTQQLSKVPEAVRHLIEETVEVIKLYRQESDDVHYKFKFSQLQLEVLVGDVDEKLQIQISAADGDLKDDMFSDENRKLLLYALQKEFPEEEIELIFVHEESRSSSDSSDQQQQQQQHENQNPQSQSDDDA